MQTRGKNKPRIKLNSKTARRAVPAGEKRQEPLTLPGVDGCYLQYRRRIDGDGGDWHCLFVDLKAKFDGRTRRFKRALGRADDTWPADGRRVLSYSDAIEKAHQFYKECRAVPDTAAPKRPETTTLADAMAAFFESKERTGKRAKGLAEDKSRVKWVLETLGTVKVVDLTADVLEAAMNEYTKLPRRQFGRDGATAQTADELRARRGSANRVLAVVQAALNHAIKRDAALAIATPLRPWMLTEKFDGVKINREAKLTHAEALKLIAAMDGTAKAITQAAMMTGCRQGELRLMQVGHLRRTPAGGAYLHLPAANTKANKERRVPLTRAAGLFFDGLAAGRDAGDYLFGLGNGKHAPTKEWAMKQFKKAANDAGTDISFHGLRHCRASWLADAGLAMDDVSLALGHSQGHAITAGYVHADIDGLIARIETGVGELDAKLAELQQAAVAPLRRRRG
ncbi:MAG: tyrosine-type recombinase/integrase [Holophagales bacterium]|jgi:integrase|nr:tyrosine-type recombinase/integrase [Holophagales bacterium]